jgi:hypothetical protein
MLMNEEYSSLRCSDDGRLEVLFLCEFAVKQVRKVVVLY